MPVLGIHASATVTDIPPSIALTDVDQGRGRERGSIPVFLDGAGDTLGVDSALRGGSKFAADTHSASSRRSSRGSVKSDFTKHMSNKSERTVVSRTSSEFKRERVTFGQDALAELENYRKGSIFPNPHQLAQRIVDNKYFVAWTFVLTVYALVGDDIRLLFTNKPADLIFNLVTLVCLFFFSCEIGLSCVGKNDYAWGFFFFLDVISTVTLILDLSWVTSQMNSGDDMDRMRSGRTARIGARAGRVVRVIRLVRILKLYKAIYFAKKEKERARKQKRVHAEDEDDWDDDDDDPTNAAVDPSNPQESRVGKKLSEITIRRVIILVLTMLMALPYMQPDDSYLTAQAPWYAADDVHEAFQIKEANTSRADLAILYQKALLKFIYYNNWFTLKTGCPGESMCSNDYYSSLFWFGLRSRKPLRLQPIAEGAKLSGEQVEHFQNTAAQNNYVYNYGTMPTKAVNTLSKPWSDSCSLPNDNPPLYRYGLSLLSETIENFVDYAAPCPEDLRVTERINYFPRLLSEEQVNDWCFEFYFDSRPFSHMDARYGILITVFVCVVLTIASLYFSTDANRLVLGPVEKMIERLDQIRRNPLVAMKMADDEFREEEKHRAKLRRNKTLPVHKRIYAKCQSCLSTSSSTTEPMETVVLEKTIIKLGSLLALGFGEAGVHIIGHNMKSGDSAGVNVMVMGSLVDCIIGNTRIKDFSTATEVLQGKVLTFVNQVAEIVHGLVDEYHGAPNKNNGENFLLVWRSQTTSHSLSRLADMSLVACSKILGAVHTSPTLAKYRSHPGLQMRLGAKQRVRLTFGLHAGWAIEGAVGSEYKIDASYLSPNVSVAKGVERATSIYGVPVLCSEKVLDLLSAPMAQKCRLIDRVMIAGSKRPLTLHSLDLDYERLKVDPKRDPKMVWNSRQRFKARQFLEIEKAKKIESQMQMHRLFESFQDINEMRANVSVDFDEKFNMGFQNYKEGEWEVARRLLTEARNLLESDDGPSAAIIRYMETFNFNPPAGWRGIRNLELI